MSLYRAEKARISIKCLALSLPVRSYALTQKAKGAILCLEGEDMM